MNVFSYDIPQAIETSLDMLDRIGEYVEGENQNQREWLKDMPLYLEVYKPLSTLSCIPKCIMGGLEDLVAYVDEFLNGTDKDFNYTYHDLYNKYFDKCISEIERYKYTRRATLPVAGDASYESEYPPCLQLMLPRIIKLEDGSERLTLMVVFRSNDAVKAFPMNLVAVAMFQKKLAEYFNVEVGQLRYVVNSFHCYQADIEKLKAYNDRFRDCQDLSEIAFTLDEYYEVENEYKRQKELSI